SLQGKDNVIRQLKKQLSQLQVTRSDTGRTLQVQTADSQITKLTEQVTNLQAQNSLFRAENDKIKQHYKELKDEVNPQVPTREKHAIDVEPIVSRLRNNRDAHLDYFRHLKESVETIRDIIEEAKVPKSNVKPNTISPAKGVNKLPVEDQPRTNKSHLRTSNRVDSSRRLKRTEPPSIRHNYDVVRKVKQVWKPKQVRQVWKPTGKVLTTIGHQWRPTGRIFNFGKQCPLTRFTSPKVVSAKHNKKRASRTDHPLVFGFKLLKTYDEGSLTNHEFREKVHRDS
nr:hypothetical protein [Tanacetum cinerariifolium]